MSRQTDLHSESAYRVLLDLILQGRVAADAPISERQVAEAYGFSRTPVREAMKALVRDGLLEAKPAHGTFVRAINPEQLAHLFEVRQLLECRAASLAAAHAPECALDRTRTALMESRAFIETDIARVYETGADFHIQVVKASGNGVLLDTYLPIRNRYRVAIGLARHYDKDWVAAGIDQHLKILDAIAARDAALARRLMSSHLKRSHASKRRILDRLKREGSGGRMVGAPPADSRVQQPEVKGRTMTKAATGVAALATLAIAAGLAGAPALAQDGPTLAKVKERGEVNCGVHQGRYGFAIADSEGKYKGLDVDYCRAVAAAVLGDSEKVKYIPTSSVQRFPALQSGEIDMLSRTTTVTLTRDSSLGLNFGPPTFYTGTGFMVRKSVGATKVEELDGATICVLPGSTTEKNIAALFKSKNLTYQPVVIENQKAMVGAYFAERCDVMSMDQAGLPGHRMFDAKVPDDHVILEGVFSKEPLAIGVRQGDDQWYDIIKWVTYATFNAEEMGITSANVDEMRSSNDPNVQLMIGKDTKIGEKLGLDNDWAYRVVKQVGNYEEIYERNFGSGSPLKLPRGLNTLWTNGGLLYGFPIK
jgi:general L-amino acid transport system substrate-binding protein